MSKSEVSAKSLPRWLGGVLVVWTWLLMALGALTRAAQAGVSCPDWPLCHGHIIPPIDAGFYPADPRYAVYRVYFEFLHRVLAGVLAAGAAGLITIEWRRGMRGIAAALSATLGVQIAMGAVTVWLRNAPFTVVIHLALALSFLAVLITSLRAFGVQLSPQAPPRYLARGYKALAVAVVVQLLLGGVVSSRSIGLACADFPLCNGFPIPLYWTEPIAWQIAHRTVGYVVLLGSVALLVVARLEGATARETTIATGLVLGVSVQIMLGGLNIWLRIPPIVSAAHLACAVALFAVVVERVVSLGGSTAPSESA
ncbi:MAG: COX15/CtaA family protein [Polyangiaceae bacterium]|jgi:heme A synthase